MIASTIAQTISELRAVADVDFIDMSFIAESLREDLNLQSQDDIRTCSLHAVRCLMRQGVCPGDYDHAAAISFWSGGEDDIVKRIEDKWISMGRTPTLEHPICWFGLKNSHVV